MQGLPNDLIIIDNFVTIMLWIVSVLDVLIIILVYGGLCEVSRGMINAGVYQTLYLHYVGSKCLSDLLTLKVPFANTKWVRQHFLPVDWNELQKTLKLKSLPLWVLLGNRFPTFQSIIVTVLIHFVSPISFILLFDA